MPPSQHLPPDALFIRYGKFVVGAFGRLAIRTLALIAALTAVTLIGLSAIKFISF
jgi:hypothetical protein